MDTRTDYKEPRLLVVELKVRSMLCTSPVPKGSASVEGYTEEELDW